MLDLNPRTKTGLCKISSCGFGIYLDPSHFTHRFLAVNVVIAMSLFDIDENERFWTSLLVFGVRCKTLIEPP